MKNYIIKTILFVLSLSFTLFSFIGMNANAVTNLAISPVFECGIDRLDGKYTAVFGYLNRNDETISVPVGANNKFTPSPIDRGQTTSFLPGRGYSVYAVTDTYATTLVWRLAYPTSGRTATASYTGALNKPCSATVAANFPY